MTVFREYCSIKTVAEALDCSESTVHEYTNRGLLPQPYRKGSLVRWKWSEIERAMQGHQATDTAEVDPILRAINGG